MGRTSSLKNKYLYLPKNIIAIVDTNGNRAYIDSEDIYKVTGYTFYKDNSGYFRTYKNKKALFLHNIITGKTNTTYITDHINRCKLDNRKCNLRITSQKKNAINTKLNKNNTSGYTGVRFEPDRNKYRAFIGKRPLGRYNTIEEAIKARDMEESKYV